MKTIQEMARPWKWLGTEGWTFNRLSDLEAFATLVREDANAKANASWTLMCEKMVAIERERIANWYESEGHMMFPVAIPDAIRSGK